MAPGPRAGTFLVGEVCAVTTFGTKGSNNSCRGSGEKDSADLPPDGRAGQEAVGSTLAGALAFRYWGSIFCCPKPHVESASGLQSSFRFTLVAGF